MPSKGCQLPPGVIQVRRQEVRVGRPSRTLRAFSRQAKAALGQSDLFTAREIKTMLWRLGIVHKALGNYPHAQERAVSLLQMAPTLLGIKPMIDIESNHSKETKQLEEWFRALQQISFPPLVSRSEAFSPITIRTAEGETVTPFPNAEAITLADIRSIYQAAREVRDPGIRQQLRETGFWRAVRQKDHQRIMEICDRELDHACGIFLGYPEPAVLEFIKYPQKTEEDWKKASCARWSDLSIFYGNSDQRLAERAIDHFDAAVELAYEYVSKVRGFTFSVPFADWMSMSRYADSDRVLLFS